MIGKLKSSIIHLWEFLRIHYTEYNQKIIKNVNQKNDLMNGK
jgi:uncharacterized ubiquitin-like protein YukD